MSRTGWVSLPDAAVRARTSWAVMWRAVLTGAVEARRVRGRWFIRPGSLDNWITERAQVGRAAPTPTTASAGR